MKTEVLPALKTYGRYTIHRHPTRVAFGCGAVKITNADLKKLAKIIEGKLISDAQLRILPFLRNNCKGIAFSGDITEFQKMASLLKEAKITPELKVVNRIKMNLGGRVPITKVLKMDSVTILRILGPVKIKK
jgi:hypothetical protein